ncbi:PLP-dependent aminotransferase family protein [Stutzerimonas zhaodongensis]|uniref:MocR-like pyridoxine biosynthesis transcription factor PdxR n=1 Tax=Stutzerimonas zhaodongensis TaxID=1176257 RepID=UPI0039F0094D
MDPINHPVLKRSGGQIEGDTVRRTWNSSIQIDRAAAAPLTVQIVGALTERIRAGLLKPGEALPGTRELATQLGVNRKTVVQAYDELTSQGWLTSHARRRTSVSAELPILRKEQRVTTAAQQLAGRLAEPGYEAYGRPLAPSADVQLDLIDFTDGAPDTRLIPFEDLSKAFRIALIESARGNRMGYGDPRGLPLLRRELAAMLRGERGLNADEDSLCVVRGSQMGIYLTAKLLVRAGDGVAMEQLSYPPARDAFRACGGTIHNLEQDEQGVIPESLEMVCRAHRIRAVYLTPHHQFPTTVTMPLDRRLRILALAEQFDFVVVEDDYDHEFHFSHNPVLPMASLDQGGRVIYIASLSKILAPGLRVGYVVAPPAIIDRLASEIMLIDRQGSIVTERAAAELLLNGKLKRHIRRALKEYEQRCQLAVRAVEQRLGSMASVTAPGGGLALWVRFTDTYDTVGLAQRALEGNIRVLPGSTFCDSAFTVHALRLGYGSMNEHEFRGGVERLFELITRDSR